MKNLIKIGRLLLMLLCLAATIPQLQAQIYTVAGTQNGFLGSSWSPSDTNNDMVPLSGTTYYYLAKPPASMKGTTNSRSQRTTRGTHLIQVTTTVTV